MGAKSQKGRHTGMRDQMVMGMPVDDLIAGASSWYDTTGRHLLQRRQYSGDMKEQQAALDATNPVHPNYIGNSNILKGMPWSLLTQQERYRIVKNYTLAMKEEMDKK